MFNRACALVPKWGIKWAGEWTNVIRITSPIQSPFALAAHLRRCILVTLKKSQCRDQNIIWSWTMTWPTNLLFSQSLSGWVLTITESYWPWGFVTDGGVTWSVWGGSRSLLWYNICCMRTLCQMWSLMLSGGTVLPFCCVRKVETAGMRLGSLNCTAALARVSCNKGSIATWNTIVEVANMQKGLGAVWVDPFRRASEAEK